MKLIGAIVTALALSACGGGGSHTVPDPIGNAPTQYAIYNDGQTFSLLSPVPVFDTNAAIVHPDGSVTIPQVGTTSTVIAPSPSHDAYVINGKASVFCAAALTFSAASNGSGLITGFNCQGNPFA